MSVSGFAQSADERLGPADSGHKKLNALVDEMRTLKSQVRPELANVHPRVYFTDAELKTLRAKAHGPQRAWWMKTLANARALKADPPPPPAEMRRQQNDVAFAIAEAAFFYKIEGDRKYLVAAKKYMDAAVSYDVWGYSFSKPNVDLAAGHLLYGMGVAYDLLYNDLTEAERTKYRGCIARHGELLYAYFAPRPGRSWAYSQNHTFIPMAGLAVAAYAVYGEVPQAAKWAALARAIYDRTLATYSQDGYYYEGFEYWVFSTPWIIHYLDAHKHATGEDLFNQPGLKLTHLYAAHSLTPGGEFEFDFGDVFEGPVSRDRKGNDYERSHPNGKMESNYSLLYDLAREYHSSEIQGVADWMRSLGHTSQEEWWTLVWRDSSLASKPMGAIEPWHRFADHDVAYWRSGWGKDATAIAFKCGPPEGHHAAALMHKYPDWHVEEGHAHPDVNSFIIWSHGHYLTGDSGYAGVPKTIEHNTLLVNGHGQGSENGGHDAWAKFNYDRLNDVRLTQVRFDRAGFELTGEGAGAYAAKLGLMRYERRLKYASGVLRVEDLIETSAPAELTEVLHADGSIDRKAGQQFVLRDGRGGSLPVELLVPPNANVKVEDNVVMGPGKPGSVDKGALERRGSRLMVSIPEGVLRGDFRWKIAITSGQK
ncbi:MAG: DUF4962 domain-containing protein [Acidobacteria bacterium]|nr:DUF4962 domain-containing protein [Acidobacteriota bacterium]